MDRLVRKAEEIMRAGDQIIEKKKRRAVMIRRIAVSSAGFCAAIVLCFAAFRPDTDLFRGKSGKDESLIAGTYSSYSEADERTEASVTDEISASVNTEAPTKSQTDTAASTTATITKKTNTTETISASSTTISSSISTSGAVTASTAEARITATSYRTETKITTTTSATTNIGILTTTVAGTEHSILTTVTEECTTNGNLSGGEERVIFKVEYGGGTYLYHGGSCDNNGSYLGSIEVIQNNAPVHLDLYRIDGVSEDYAFLVQQNGGAEKYVFVNMDYEPKSLQRYFSDIGLTKYWEIPTFSYREEMPLKTLRDDELIGIFVRLPDTEPVQNISPGNEIAKFLLDSTRYSLQYLVLRLTDNGCLTIYDYQNLFVFNIGADSMRMIIPDFKG